MKSLLEKAKDDNKDPHLTMLEARNTSVDNYRSSAELAIGRQLRSILPVNPSIYSIYMETLIFIMVIMHYSRVIS